MAFDRGLDYRLENEYAPPRTSARALFIQQTYAILAGAILAFVGLEALLLNVVSKEQVITLLGGAAGTRPMALRAPISLRSSTSETGSSSMPLTETGTPWTKPIVTCSSLSGASCGDLVICQVVGKGALAASSSSPPLPTPWLACRARPPATDMDRRPERHLRARE